MQCIKSSARSCLCGSPMSTRPRPRSGVCRPQPRVVRKCQHNTTRTHFRTVPPCRDHLVPPSRTTPPTPCDDVSITICLICPCCCKAAYVLACKTIAISPHLSRPMCGAMRPVAPSRSARQVEEYVGPRRRPCSADTADRRRRTVPSNVRSHPCAANDSNASPRERARPSAPSFRFPARAESGADF